MKDAMHVIRIAANDSEMMTKAFEIRREVFVKEQEVAEEEEFDEYEDSSVHFIALIDGKAVGTSRWRKTDKGVKLERFAVLKNFRQAGVGKALIENTLKDVMSAAGRIYMHAQTDVIPFYHKYGFVPVGEEFEECDIKHYEMEYNEVHGKKRSMTLEQLIKHVHDFHEAFLIGNEDIPKAVVKEKDYQLRYQLMKEENEEYLEAAKNGDLVEIADALGDMLYILCGTILKHGLQDQMAAIFEEIQRSNMSKLDENGQPIYREDGKVLKSDRYFKPNIAQYLKNHI